MRKTFLEYCNGNRIEVDIPNKFSYKEGKIEDGLVIENDTGEYVRIPAGYTTYGMYVKGFWISRYEISSEDGKNPLSVANRYPLTDINLVLE